MQILTAQELHNLAMNIVGDKLREMGYEFQAINSQLKRHPQFVLFKKGEPTIFVLVKATNNIQNSNEYDVLWMETFKNHAKKQNAKVWFARACRPDHSPTFRAQVRPKVRASQACRPCRARWC